MVSNSFYFHPYLRKIPSLTDIFQRGWNHQPAFLFLSVGHVSFRVYDFNINSELEIFVVCRIASHRKFVVKNNPKNQDPFVFCWFFQTKQRLVGGVKGDEPYIYIYTHLYFHIHTCLFRINRFFRRELRSWPSQFRDNSPQSHEIHPSHRLLPPKRMSESYWTFCSLTRMGVLTGIPSQSCNSMVHLKFMAHPKK